MSVPASVVVSEAEARLEARAYLGLLGASVAWAVAFIIGKNVLASMTPLAVAAWRYGLAGLVLLPFVLRDPGRVHLRSVAAPLALMTVFGGILYPWLFLGALARTSATNASLLIALNPAFTVAFAPLVGERLTTRAVAGVIIALAGACLVITRGDLGVVARLGFHAGDLLAVGGAATWAIFNLASRRVLGVVSPTLVNGTVFLISSVALFAIGSAERPMAQMAVASFSTWIGILVMAILPSVIAGQLFLGGVRTVGVSRAVIFVYLVPVLTAALAAVTLGEDFGVAQGVGGLLVLAGVGLTSRAR